MREAHNFVSTLCVFTQINHVNRAFDSLLLLFFMGSRTQSNETLCAAPSLRLASTHRNTTPDALCRYSLRIYIVVDLLYYIISDIKISQCHISYFWPMSDVGVCVSVETSVERCQVILRQISVLQVTN